MSEAKMIVLYPAPADQKVFDAEYAAQHVPMVHEKGKGAISRVVLTKISGAAGGSPAPFYLMAEVYFTSEEVMRGFAETPEGQAIGANAVSISTGGLMSVWFAEETQTIEI
jgi:uncharacterized protein (TIGR02118 family)